jgi:hypothetical protein
MCYSFIGLLMIAPVTAIGASIAFDMWYRPYEESFVRSLVAASGKRKLRCVTLVIVWFD